MYHITPSGKQNINLFVGGRTLIDVCNGIRMIHNWVFSKHQRLLESRDKSYDVLLQNWTLYILSRLLSNRSGISYHGQDESTNKNVANFV